MSLVTEEYRSNKVKELRKLYAKLCKDIGIDEPRGSFNRWLLENGDRALGSVAEHNNKTLDYIIPSQPNMTPIKNEILEDVPVKLNFTTTLRDTVVNVEKYVKAVEGLLKKYNNKNEKILKVLGELSTIDNLDYNSLNVKFSQIRSKIDPYIKELVLSKIDQSLITLAYESTKYAAEVAEYKPVQDSMVNIKKERGMVLLSHKTKSVSISLQSYNLLKSKYKGNKFDTDVYRLLTRYQTLTEEEDGLQISVSNKIFYRLIAGGVTGECFASPLNSNLSQTNGFWGYMSAFYDTDHWFGSRGSFWKIDLPSGFYECNPPFSEIFMNSMVARLDTFLRKDEAMSFICFVPAWDDSPAIIRLLKSQYSTVILKFTNNQPLFTKNGKSFALPNGTYVCLLQNAKGKTTWYFDSELLSTLLS